MDVLSDVLSAVRLTGAVYFDICARTPWVVDAPPVACIAPEVMPESERLMAFHVLVEGWCWAQLTDGSEPALQLSSGDAVLFAHGDGHCLGTEPGRRAQPDVRHCDGPDHRRLPFAFAEFGGKGEPAHLVCGYFGCDERPFNPILDALPRTLHVRGVGPNGGLLRELIRFALQESARPRLGAEGFLAKLSELMLLQAVREHMDTLPKGATGWFSGLRDPHIGASLRLMHGRPAEAWTLETLAREIGLSRSVFAERFSLLIGTPPMHYLSNFRLQLAARMLASADVTLAQAAAAVGYESEAAFNRAFKKLVGVPPGAFRRGASSACHNEPPTPSPSPRRWSPGAGERGVAFFGRGG